jgi:glutamate-5-semialdehyde dehydrogenase
MRAIKIAGISKDCLPALANSPTGQRNRALSALAQGLSEKAREILSANREDLTEASRNGLSPALLDRLSLDPGRLSSLARGILEVASLPDPLGRTEPFRTMPDGFLVGKLRVPIGVIAFVCEARPGAVAEAASLALKSGNALIAKPGKEAARTSQAIGLTLEAALAEAGLPPGAVQVVPDLSREELKDLLSLEDMVDLAIPRGGEGLIRFVAEHSRVPVLKHYKGVCHLYVDQGADLAMAADLAINAKASRPGTCNALECLLVARSEAESFFPILEPRLKEAGIKIKGGPGVKGFLPSSQEAGEEDFGKEFLELTLAVKIVAGLDEALEHIAVYGSRHTEAIATRDQARSLRFLKEADASCVLVNASTRLNDGGCLGLGCEIGISTSKVHAYGPMGLKELTSSKFLVIGQGHLRQ